MGRQLVGYLLNNEATSWMPVNSAAITYKLEIVIYLALCVPSALLFKLDLTIGLAHTLWHNLLTR